MVDDRLGYAGPESSAAIAYTQGVLEVLRERLVAGRPITVDDLDDLLNCVGIARDNRQAEQEAAWKRHD